MIQITTTNKPDQKKVGQPPDESSLRLMLENNLRAPVEELINIWDLKYRVVVNKDGKLILEDSVVGADLWLKKFITNDPDTIVMKQEAKKLAKINDEVLILGETGTGKELIARAMIGDLEGGFYRINCAGLPENLIESELFGHVAGAFTDAKSSKKGLMEMAKGGVLFLDEIGDLPLNVQAKLLNSLQPIDGKRYIRPVGSNEEREITCRIVCATHRDLRDMVNKGMFRQDLYARISTFEIKIKSLKDRECDIEPIVREIGDRLKCPLKAAEFLDRYISRIQRKEIDLSLNVRSLEQYVKRYSVLGRI